MPEGILEKPKSALTPLTDKEILELEQIAVQDNPLNLVTEKFLSIKTKAGELTKLTLNSTQRKVLEKIKSIQALNKPVRLWILKARQAGISTLIEAILYANTSQRKAVNSLVVADDIDGANYIFGMQKLYHEMLDRHLKPEIKHSNEKKLEFEGIQSQVLIDTADNLKLGRKYTFRSVHLSECAYFRDLKTMLAGLMPAIPNLPGTLVIGETTANGIGNQFYDEWVACQNGLSDWQALFIAWWEIEEYRLPLVNGWYPIDAIEFPTATEREKFLEEEKQLKARYNLTDEQLNWRRWCIVNICNRSVLTFNQDFPDSWETAFISTGNLFFDKEALKQQEIKKPIAIGNIVKEEGKYIFREDALGVFKLYESPQRGEQFIIAGDPAEGLEHGDKSAGIVINKRTNSTACAYNANIPPDRFAEDLIKMASYYNEGIIACENKGYGYGVNQDIYKRYGRVYRRLKTKKGFPEQMMDLGFNTNSVTRPQILAQLAEEIAEGSTELNDRELIQQCWTFINNPKRGQPEAEKGKCDDLVMCRAIAGQVRLEQPYKEKFGHKPRRKRYKGLGGY